MASIGLLMIVPNVQALECYESVTKNASSTMGGRVTWELNKMFRIENGQEESPLEVSIGGGGNAIKQCSAGYTFCATLHCAKLYGIA
jgi:hypothetical protein